MRFAVTIQDETVWVNGEKANVQIDFQWLKREESRW